MKLKALVVAVMTLITAFCAVAAPKNRAAMVTKTTALPASFSKIKLSRGVEVKYVVDGNVPQITVEGLPDYVDMVRTKTSGGELYIYLESDTKTSGSRYINGKTLLPIRVSGPALESISADSGADFELQNVMRLGRKSLKIMVSSGAKVENKQTIECSGMTINASSAGDVDLEWLIVTGGINVNASSAANVDIERLDQKEGTVEVSTSSAAKAELSGNADKVSLIASSSSNIDAAKLNCAVVNADASSASDIKISRLGGKIREASGAKVKIVNKKK